MPRKFTDKQVARIIEDYTAKRKSSADIAVRHGVSPAVILRVLRGAEVTIRPRGRQPKSAAA